MKTKANAKNLSRRKTTGKPPAAEPTALTIAARLPRIKGKTPGERINFLHQLSVASGKLSIAAAILAGWELLQIHGAIPHGEWLSWLQKHTALSEATARRYMAVYSSTLGVARAALPKPKPPTKAPSQEELQEACANVEASSITGLYQQLQLLKRNDNHGGAREGAGRKPILQPGDSAESGIHKSAVAAWGGIARATNSFLKNKFDLALSASEAKDALSIVQTLADAFKGRIAELSRN